ncbi:hypothetical protein DM793_18665 [Paenarthrobacter nitroguajacolicus]|uniref:hypothetical protein n=1 Tax=Paenarthrobacter nitroguajacolicus TaxID=211146 RepID=UPI0015BC3166|nr:hypothetical protein [Paenarthrobacter nitroguajacolicus]NWL13291.1 hypothetical protein [Paenarthrobacter nitroguajacolicus]
MIRKEAKAHWVYTYNLCNVLAAYPDQFRAIERQQRHERSGSHEANAMGAVLRAAAKPIAEAFRQLGLAWGDLTATMTNAANAMQGSYALVPPPNIPHDPALRLDHRKWGGR